MEHLTSTLKIVAFGFLILLHNIVLAQDIVSFATTDHMNKNSNQPENTQWIFINTEPSTSFDGTYFEHYDWNESDTVSGYISDSTMPFTAPASVHLLGTKIGDFYMEFDYIDEPFYIYDVIIPIRTPENITATLNCNHVTLSWDWEFLGYLPNVNDQFEGFNIYRNDSLLNQDPVQDTFYVDRHVPVGEYDYYVETLFTDATHSPAYDTVTVEKDYDYGDVIVTAEGMGVTWTLENQVNISSSLNGYDLYRNGEFLETTPNNYIIFYYPPEGPAEYCVMASFDDGCHSQMGCDTLYPAVSNSLPQENRNPKLSPNPANDFVSLEYSRGYDYIVITTLSGVEHDRISLSDHASQVQYPLQGYKRGIYVVSWFKDGTRRHTQKLIVHR